MEDEIGTPPAGDGFLSGTISPSYHSDRGSNGAWGPRTLQTHPSFKRYGHSWVEPQRKTGNSNPPPQHEGEATAIDLISLLEENWFWRSSPASPTIAGTDLRPRLEAPRTPTRMNHRMAGASPSREPNGVRADPRGDGEGVATPPERNSLEREESTESEREATAGSDLVRRKTRSAEFDEGGFQERVEEVPRPHSYAHQHHPRVDEAKPEINIDAIETIGTWGHRVIRFPADNRRPSTPTHIPGTPDERELPRPKSGGRGGNSAARAESEDDAAAVNAAWKWRFNRRWRTEQAKQLDPDFGMEGDDEDGWDDALGYLDACGPGVQHQIARTTSMEQNLAGDSSVASNASEMSQLLVDESQKEKGGLQAQAEMDATKKVRSVAKKAQNLYWKQKEIEKDVKTRWGNTLLSMSWAGQHMKVVEIDSHGQFLVVLVRVSDRTKVQRLLVRGRNNATKEDLMKDVKRQAENVCHDFKLPPITISLVGSGTLSWSQGRDHGIDVSSGHVEKFPDSTICSGEDVCRVVGNLTRTSMPAPHRVTVEGRKLS